MFELTVQFNIEKIGKLQGFWQKFELSRISDWPCSNEPDSTCIIHVRRDVQDVRGCFMTFVQCMNCMKMKKYWLARRGVPCATHPRSANRRQYKISSRILPHNLLLHYFSPTHGKISDSVIFLPHALMSWLFVSSVVLPIGHTVHTGGSLSVVALVW